ncbi:hypothetical protein llap_11261 [Limosa lapponica baueri]|uniref:Uncharacterized protein n=1 Tax=Limosa lapponica baueri TaxID=1758121 RepID=A0A2I0TXD9_LIMLA|nr:hypothetical protein llap_11261 [Limosa lapponica baueri]
MPLQAGQQSPSLGHHQVAASPARSAQPRAASAADRAPSEVPGAAASSTKPPGGAVAPIAPQASVAPVAVAPVAIAPRATKDGGSRRSHNGILGEGAEDGAGEGDDDGRWLDDGGGVRALADAGLIAAVSNGLGAKLPAQPCSGLMACSNNSVLQEVMNSCDLKPIIQSASVTLEFLHQRIVYAEKA